MKHPNLYIINFANFELFRIVFELFQIKFLNQGSNTTELVQTTRYLPSRNSYLEQKILSDVGGGRLNRFTRWAVVQTHGVLEPNESSLISDIFFYSEEILVSI